MLRRLLIVTAVLAERDAVLAGLGGRSVYPHPLAENAYELTVLAVGVGPVAAAAGTARQLGLAEAAGAPYSAVVCAGIAGGFAGRTEVGDVVLGTASVAADLGADSPDGFLPIDALGFGSSRVECAGLLAVQAKAGEILTVTTATGTAERAEALADAHPDALAEAMEGFGAATAAQLAGLPYAEVRAISNLIGPRDTSTWRFDLAFAALSNAFREQP